MVSELSCSLVLAVAGGLPLRGLPLPDAPIRTGALEVAADSLRETADHPWMPRAEQSPPDVSVRCAPVVRGTYRSIQVNVDPFGCNIPGDAANEPSIAANPANARRMAIGWRQFDTVESNFRQAGWSYSQDGGRSWMFPGVLESGVFRSDPVLDADAEGNLYYYSIRCTSNGCGDLFKSVNGGLSWHGPVFAYGADKPWMVVDRTGGPGRGNIYAAASGEFARSTDGGGVFANWVMDGGDLWWATMAVGPAGEVYVGRRVVAYNAWDETGEPDFVHRPGIYLGSLHGPDGLIAGPNPWGLLGQYWMACDVSGGPHHGALYVLAATAPAFPVTPHTQIMFARSIDDAITWSEPLRINDDPSDNNAWHWFGTMSVAPNGRIDAVWNDTRNTGQANLSELYYSYSLDGGLTWSPNEPISPVFNSHLGWPQDNRKLGDYYHIVSDNLGVNVAYAATFNGEQDVYFLRIGPYDCNGNEIPDVDDIADGVSLDCNANEVPDECEYRGDFNGDRLTALDDHANYLACFSAPGAPYAAPCCGLFDIEPDADVDLADFAFVQRAFAVPGP